MPPRRTGRERRGLEHGTSLSRQLRTWDGAWRVRAAADSRVARTSAGSSTMSGPANAGRDRAGAAGRPAPDGGSHRRDPSSVAWAGAVLVDACAGPPHVGSDDGGVG